MTLQYDGYSTKLKLMWLPCFFLYTTMESIISSDFWRQELLVNLPCHSWLNSCLALWHARHCKLQQNSAYLQKYGDTTVILTAGYFDSSFTFTVHIINTSLFESGLLKRGFLCKIILNHCTNGILSQTLD